MNIAPEIVYPLGALALFAVLLWAALYVKGRNRVNDRVTEAATKAEYDHPESYQDEQGTFQRQVQK